MSLLTSSESVVAYTYNVGSSNVHLIMVLFCLGWSGNLCLILYLQKEHRMVEENRAEDNEATYTTQIEKNIAVERELALHTFAVLMISVKFSRMDLISSFNLLL